jgi:hypothetical protein
MELRERLASELLPSEWKMLAMHHRRDALFIVRGAVPLLEVALAVAEDRTADVAAWIEAGAIERPTPAEVEAWEREEGAQFVGVIVQPFVLAQRLEHFAGGGAAS